MGRGQDGRLRPCGYILMACIWFLWLPLLLLSVTGGTKSTTTTTIISNSSSTTTGVCMTGYGAGGESTRGLRWG